jgi:hypothetical protein
LAGSTRFNDPPRGIPNITAGILSRRLDELEIAGIIERREDEDGPHYSLTTAGEELRPLVEAREISGRRWLPTDYGDQNHDPRLLVWDIHRKCTSSRSPGARSSNCTSLTRPPGTAGTD